MASLSSDEEEEVVVVGEEEEDNDEESVGEEEEEDDGFSSLEGNEGGTIKKRVVREGEFGFGYPDSYSGDVVEIHYTVSLLDGTQLDSSYDRGTPITFILGKGYALIKGWDERIDSMKKGEKAIFIIPPEMGYGESGLPPTIPPGAPLRFEIELLSWTKDICKDGGILMKALKGGGSLDNPDQHDEVLVKFEAQLEDGTVVSKSDGVEFAIKDGYFCPAVSKAVKRMGKGEKVLLIVQPKYGFGEQGKPATGDEGAVPSNAALHIELELLSWITAERIGYDKKIIKKILKQGKKVWNFPPPGGVVKVKLIGKLQDGAIFIKKGHDGEEPFEFKVDEEEVIEGLDEAVMTMEVGEVSLIIIPPEYAFGSNESKQDLAVVPPNSVVIYEVELVSIEGKRFLRMSSDEKVNVLRKYKEDGDMLFKMGKYKRASNRFGKAANLVRCYGEAQFDNMVRQLNLRVSCNLSDAACRLKLKDYKTAENLCTVVLQIDSGNVTALRVRAQAYTKLAAIDLTQLQKLKDTPEISNVMIPLYMQECEGR